MAQKHRCQTEIPAVVLGVAAHPDDLDFGAAGAIASWVSQGAKAYYLILTNGNKGSADRNVSPEALAEIRRNEQRKAASILGVSDVFFCSYDDGLLTVSMEVKKDIVRIIRQVKPDVVITMDPSMIYDAERGYINHPDHRAAGQATLDAVYPLARDHLSFPELYKEESLEPHNVQTILLTNFHNNNCFVDISNSIEVKKRALAAHASQFQDMHATEKVMCSFATEMGKQSGVQYAEGFIKIVVR